MAKKENEVSPSRTFGVRHTKTYVPSLISEHLVEYDFKGRFIKRLSDVHLILRQQSLQRSIGVKALRRHFNKARMNGNMSGSTDHLTDDQLFSLIEPKAVNNLTTTYEWANYLQELKKKHDEYLALKKKDQEFWETFKPKSKKKSESDNSNE